MCFDVVVFGVLDLCVLGGGFGISIVLRCGCSLVFVLVWWAIVWLLL